MLLTPIQIVILAVFGVWNLSLTVLFYLMFSHYRRLISGAKDSNLKKVLDKILDVQGENKKDLVLIKREIARLDEEMLTHVQKVGLVHFNPFADTGGSQSFSLALLDGQSSGVVISILHSRERSRIYIKSIEKGKSSHELSREERKAIDNAAKN